MSNPGYTQLNHDLLRAVINSEGQTNAFMLITPHGEIIYDAPAVRNQPVLAMCYSGVPLTVNYSSNDENVRVLGIVDNNLHSTLRDESFASHTKKSEKLAAQALKENPHHFQKILELTPGNPTAIYEELQSLASAVKKGDTEHHDSKKMAATGASQVNDAHRSFLFSQSYPITKMVADDGRTIPLQNVVHPNKRYTLRVDDDGLPEVVRGIEFEYKMNLFLPISSRSRFETHLGQLEKSAGIIIVTKDNCRNYQHIVPNVNGTFPGIILGKDSAILASWNIILLPVTKSMSSKKSHEVTTYYMLPYRFHTLSGVKCIVFDLWHILSYNDPRSAYSTGGLSMTQTDIYMGLLNLLGIQLVVGVDLTCNVVGVESGAWPLLTYDQIMRNLAFQETMLQSIEGRPLSSRLNPTLDLLPHFNHVVSELNDFLKKNITKLSTGEVLESIRTRGRIVPRREHRGFYSNDTETYLALHEYMKRLCGREAITHGETFDHETRSIMVVSKKKQKEKKSTSLATAAATSTVVPLTKDEVCGLYRLVVPHQHITHGTIEQLQKYVKDNNIRFRLTASASETFKQHFPSTEAVDEEYNLGLADDVPATVDNENKFIAFFDSILRLWVIPELTLVHHPNETPCFYHKNIEPPNMYVHLQRRVINAGNIVFEIRNAKLDKSFGDTYTLIGTYPSNSKTSRDFKPYSKFEEWWRKYKVDHKLMKLGGGNTTKMSNTRKRKPHKRAVTKRYRRFKHKSLKNKSLKK